MEGSLGINIFWVWKTFQGFLIYLVTFEFSDNCELFKYIIVQKGGTARKKRGYIFGHGRAPPNSFNSYTKIFQNFYLYVTQCRNARIATEPPQSEHFYATPFCRRSLFPAFTALPLLNTYELIVRSWWHTNVPSGPFFGACFKKLF